MLRDSEKVLAFLKEVRSKTRVERILALTLRRRFLRVSWGEQGECAGAHPLTPSLCRLNSASPFLGATLGTLRLTGFATCVLVDLRDG